MKDKAGMGKRAQDTSSSSSTSSTLHTSPSNNPERVSDSRHSIAHITRNGTPAGAAHTSRCSSSGSSSSCHSRISSISEKSTCDADGVLHFYMNGIRAEISATEPFVHCDELQGRTDFLHGTSGSNSTRMATSHTARGIDCPVVILLDYTAVVIAQRRQARMRRMICKRARLAHDIDALRKRMTRCRGAAVHLSRCKRIDEGSDSNTTSKDRSNYRSHADDSLASSVTSCARGAYKKMTAGSERSVNEWQALLHTKRQRLTKYTQSIHHIHRLLCASTIQKAKKASKLVSTRHSTPRRGRGIDALPDSARSCCDDVKEGELRNIDDDVLHSSVLLLPSAVTKRIRVHAGHYYQTVKFVGEHLCMAGTFQTAVDPTTARHVEAEKKPTQKQQPDECNDGCNEHSMEDWVDQELAGMLVFLQKNPSCTVDDFFALPTEEISTLNMLASKKKHSQTVAEQ